jgi:hypothetical protein
MVKRKKRQDFNAHNWEDPLWIPQYLSNNGHYIVFFNNNGGVSRLTIHDIKKMVNKKRRKKLKEK